MLESFYSSVLFVPLDHSHVERVMFRRSHHLEIFGAVVELIAVDMMDNLTSAETPPDFVFCDEHVFFDPAPVQGAVLPRK